MFEKYVRDGKVAVLISGGFGAGWTSWLDDDEKQQAAMDRRLVERVLSGGQLDDELLDEVLGPRQYRCTLGLPVEVQWVEEGAPFYIHEYDGSETIKSTEDLIWTA